MNHAVNSITAGALSGMVFKSTRGVKPMMISGGIVATVAGAWAVSSVVDLSQDVRVLTHGPGHKEGHV